MARSASISAGDWQRAFELADTVFDLPVAQRVQWLGNMSPDVAHLKPLLLDLLAHRARHETDDFLENFPGDFSAQFAEKIPDKFLDALPQFTQAPKELPDAASRRNILLENIAAGSVVGPYRLIRELGEGGMGVVWLAERADGTLKRAIALKLPYAGPRQKQLAERFLRERDILGGLAHKNIARLYDAGTADNGQLYLAMQYIEGLPINEYCDKNQLPVSQRLRLFQQVLSAVQYAHAHLVLHRDLKPSNILVSEDGTVNLLDFGIAKVMQGNEAKETELTALSGRALTPNYASPEQIAGTTLTTASDVYSLGVILYELLAGARPYKLKRGTRGELEEAIAFLDAARPSQIAHRRTLHTLTKTNDAGSNTAINTQLVADNRQSTPKKLSKLLAGDLDTIVLKALKKKPGERYATAAALNDDIARHQHGDAVLARPDSRVYRLQKLVFRNKLAAGSICAVVLALAAGMSVATWQAQKARQELEYSNARAVFWADLFADTAPKNHEVASPSVRALLGEGDAVIQRTRADRADLQALLYADLGRALRGVGSYQAAIPLYEKAVTKAEEAYGSSSDEAKKFRFGLVIRLVWGMQNKRFFALEPEIRGQCESPAQFKDPRCISYAGARAYANIIGGRLGDAERLTVAAIEQIRQTVPDDSASLVSLRDFVGRSQSIRGDLLTGRQPIIDALNARRNPAIWGCYECLYSAVQVMTAGGDLAHAKPFAEAFLQRHNIAVGEHSYVSNDLLRTAAKLFSLLGEDERSENLYRRTIAASLLNYGPDNINLAHSLRELGHATIRAGKFDDARAALLDAARIHEAESGPDNHWLSDARIALAGIDIAQGKTSNAAKSNANESNAVALLRAEKEIAIRNNDDTNLAYSLYWLARSEADNDAAVALALESLRIISRGGGGRTPRALDTNLLIVDRSNNKAMKQSHAARADSIARYMFGPEHALTQALAKTITATFAASGASPAAAADAALDGKLDAQDALIRAYAERVMAALIKGKP